MASQALAGAEEFMWALWVREEVRGLERRIEQAAANVAQIAASREAAVTHGAAEEFVDAARGTVFACGGMGCGCGGAGISAPARG